MEKKCEICKNFFETGKHKEKKTCGKDCLKILRENGKEERIKKSREAIIKKYGVDHPSKIPGFGDKVKKTKKEKHGDETYNNRKKAKETIKKEFGVENSMQIEESKLKTKKTKKEKYGDEHYNNRKKAKETIKKEFGVEHHLQLKEILDKQIKTNIEKNGVSYNVLSDKSKENLIKTNNIKFGSDYYFSSLDYLKETKEEKLERLRIILEERKLEFKECECDRVRYKNTDGKINYLKYDIKCTSCGNKFSSRVVKSALVCRKCYPIKSGSKIQREMSEFIFEIESNTTECERSVIKPYELDFYIKDKKLAIELNGNYYHSEISGNKNKKYHLSKSEKSDRLGIKLIHVFEDEWLLKQSIVKSRIRNLLNLTDSKIYARQCEIKEVSFEDKKEFLNSNHIQGNCVDKIRVGLYFRNELVSLITFGKPRLALGAKNKTQEEGFFELIRFCSILDTNVVGGFERLLKYFTNNYSPKKILTYADCRWSGVNPEKTVYNKVGFEFIRKTPPSYYFVKTNDYLSRLHRFSLNKIKLLETYKGDKNKTGFELAIENGYDRIWDCGTLVFEKIVK